MISREPGPSEVSLLARQSTRQSRIPMASARVVRPATATRISRPTLATAYRIGLDPTAMALRGRCVDRV